MPKLSSVTQSNRYNSLCPSVGYILHVSVVLIIFLFIFTGSLKTKTFPNYTLLFSTFIFPYHEGAAKMDRGVIANLISFPITEIQLYENSCVLGGIPNFTSLAGFKHIIIITSWGNYGSQCESGIYLLRGVFSQSAE